jgi:gag-polypeptide of LTR copia-type
LGYLEESDVSYAGDDSWCQTAPGRDRSDPPPPIPTYPDGHVLTDKEEEDLEALEKHWDDYHQQEATIKAQIFTTVPDSVLIEVRNLDTAQKVWDAVCAKYETKSLTVKIDLWRRMYEMKCEDDSNVRTHLETLMRMQEQLAGMNTPLTNDDLVTVVLGVVNSGCPGIFPGIFLILFHVL